MDSSRVIRLERWQPRAFHVVPCPFHVDLPLDMSGCIAAALHDTLRSGYRRVAGGLILASDRHPGATGALRARRDGAIFIEVEASDTGALAWIDGDVLTRALPGGPARLRGEVDELLHWSVELGHDLDGFYVGFAAAEGPRNFRATRLLATLAGGPVVETFEVQSSRASALSA
jgi:hypothetical protein